MTCKAVLVWWQLWLHFKVALCTFFSISCTGFPHSAVTPLKSWQQLICCVSTLLSIQVFSTTRITRYATFQGWLFPLSVTPWRFIQVVVCSFYKQSVPFISKQYPMVGHLGCFQFEAIMNKATMNTYKEAFVYSLGLLSLR